MCRSVWTYSQDDGVLDKDGIIVDKGCYSGGGEGFNNPAMETVADVGPIPCGDWTFVGPPYSDPQLGPYVLQIIPRSTTITFGRSAFRLHGKPNLPADINSGSKGCICAEIRTRSAVYQSGDYDLEVIRTRGNAPQENLAS